MWRLREQRNTAPRITELRELEALAIGGNYATELCTKRKRACAAVAVLSGCAPVYVPSACLDRCAERNDYCLLQALSPFEVQRCDEETAACVRACYGR